MSNIVISLAAEFVGKKAFKDADKSIGGLDGAAKKLAKTLAATFSVTAVVAFGKAAAQAFIDDQKEAAKLANTVKNLGMEFANPVIASYIGNLSKIAGVADSDLRPAFQTLLQQTGDLVKSQELLDLAILASRGSGESLATVTNDLAQAYVGNTKGLKKYYLGLTQAELKTMSFAEVQAKLNKQFSGANAAYLATYAGQMEILKVAAGEAQETIGKGLVDALALIAGDGSVQGLANSMQALADSTADVLYGLGQVVSKIKAIEQATPSWLRSLITTALKATNPVLDAVNRLANYGEKERNKTLQNPSVQMFMTDQANQRLNNAAIKKQQEAAKGILKATKTNTAELKKQAAAKKQASLFDVEQAGIIAALQGNITKEERLRLELQLALLVGNEDKAAKLSKQLANSIDQTGNLAKYLTTLPEANNPFKAWDEWLLNFKKELGAIATVTGINPPATNGSGLDFGGNKIGSQVPSTFVPDNTRYGTGGGSAPIVVQIDGKTIASALMDQSLSGNQAYVNRRTGGFE